MRFTNVNPKKGLKFFGIHSVSLKAFKQQPGKSMYDLEPDEKYRLKKEEIEAQEDFNENKKE